MSMDKYPIYLYEHSNGNIIEKSCIACDLCTTPQEYFDSPFVKRWARIENEEQDKKFREVKK